MSQDDPLDIADFRLRKLERLFRNFLIIGDGVSVEGDMSTGYSVQTADVDELDDTEAGA